MLMFLASAVVLAQDPDWTQEVIFTPGAYKSVAAVAVAFADEHFWVVYAVRDAAASDIYIVEYDPADSGCQPCATTYNPVTTTGDVNAQFAVTTENGVIHILYNIAATGGGTGSTPGGGSTELWEKDFETSTRTVTGTRLVEDPAAQTNHGVRSVVADTVDGEIDVCWTSTQNSGTGDQDAIHCRTRAVTASTWSAAVEYITLRDATAEDHPGVTFDDVTGERRLAWHSDSTDEDVFVRMWKPSGFPIYETCTLLEGSDGEAQDSPFLDTTSDDRLVGAWQDDNANELDIWFGECLTGDATTCDTEVDWAPALISGVGTDDHRDPDLTTTSDRYFLSWDNDTADVIVTANRCFNSATFALEFLTPTGEGEGNDRLGKPHIIDGHSNTHNRHWVGVPARRVFATGPIQLELVFSWRRTDNMSVCP